MEQLMTILWGQKHSRLETMSDSSSVGSCTLGGMQKYPWMNIYPGIWETWESNRAVWVRKGQRWDRTQILSLWLLWPYISHCALSLILIAHNDRNISTELVWGINKITSKRNSAKQLPLIKCPWTETIVFITIINTVQLWAVLETRALPARQGSVLELELLNGRSHWFPFWFSFHPEGRK